MPSLLYSGGARTYMYVLKGWGRGYVRILYDRVRVFTRELLKPVDAAVRL